MEAAYGDLLSLGVQCGRPVLAPRPRGGTPRGGAPIRLLQRYVIIIPIILVHKAERMVCVLAIAAWQVTPKFSENYVHPLI